MLRLPLAGLALALCASAAAAQPFAVQAAPGGVVLARGAERMEVTALRDDVLRVRIGRDGGLPRDESWAALAAARAARAAVTPCGPACFATPAMTVRIDPATGAVTVSDPQGRSLLADAAPAPYRPDGDGFRVEKRLAPDAHVFGLGDKMGPLDRRGRAFTLWNTDAYRFQESTDPLYKSIPFFTVVDQGRAVGVFLDDTFRSHFDFGQAKADVLAFGAEGGAIDYYVFAGPDPKAVLGAYAWLTGPAPLPPLWAFGYQQSRYTYGSEAIARGIVDRLRADRIPTDVIWFDIGVLDRNRAFTVNTAQFPDFDRLVADFARQGVKTVVIADLHLSATPGYVPFDSGVAGDHFLKTADGSRYTGLVWPGPSVFPDFSRRATRDWWGTLHATLYGETGVAGFWNDMNEPAVFGTPTKTMPDGVRHRIAEPGFQPRIAPHAEMHNVFGQLNSRATYEGLLALKPDRRPFVMTRATYAGGQRYAVSWTGDNSATWNHLRLSTPQLLSLGLSGFPFVGDDLGGFAGTPSTDLLTRWLQLGAFNPIMRDHADNGSGPHEPWVGGPEAEAIRRAAVETRYRLMPYVYTAAEETSRTGVPLMRPLFVEFPKAAGGRPLDLDAPSEFMWGPSLLVAPSPWPEAPDAYSVTLPPGGWYDFWTGLRVDAPAAASSIGASGIAWSAPADPAQQPHSVKVTPRIDLLPVYVRAGAIIPSQPLVQSTAETPKGPLRLDVYPGPDCHGEVYADDGISFAYRRGVSLRQRFACTAAPGGLTIEIGAPQGRFTPWWTALSVVIHDAGPALRFDPKSGVSSARYDAEHRTRTGEFPAPRKAITLTLAEGVR